MREARVWRSKQRLRKALLGDDYQGGPEDYLQLRREGASLLEAMDAILSVEHYRDKPLALACTLPPALGRPALERLLEAHHLHPLSVATHFLSRRQALAFLRRTGQESFGPWISPGGHLLLTDPAVRALPPRLVLRGHVTIQDCPALEDLGSWLTVVGGDLLIQRCPRLRELPERLETWPFRVKGGGGHGAPQSLYGNLRLVDCPELTAFGKRSRVRGETLVEGCPGLIVPRRAEGAY